METNIALPAYLIGDPIRAAMLATLCDGRAQPASALAYAACVSPQSASNHLAQLLQGGLLSVEREGRHRYYRLATPEVATAIEALACITSAIRHTPPLTQKGRSLRFGRTCYNHLAGVLGVAIAAQLQARGYLMVPDPRSKRYVISAEGRRWFEELGIELEMLKPGVRGLARQCLDWTERRHHLAGPLGTALLRRLVDLGWVRRDNPSRAVRVTQRGTAELTRRLDLDARELWEQSLEHRPTPETQEVHS
jgi:DNA-binding transcriptional ArsR family regulator